MSELRSAIDGLVAVDVAELPDAALAEDLQEIRRAINMLEAQFQRRLGVFDARGVAEQQERIGPASWLTRFCRLDPADASSRLRLAKRLRELPLVRAAFEQGEIALGHARVIGTAVAEVRHEHRAFAEQLLTKTAPHVEPIALDRTANRLRYELDTDSADERAKKQYESRGATAARTFGGAVRLVGNWDPSDGEIVLTALHAHSAPFSGDERTAAQRRADALVDICRRFLMTGQAPTSGGVHPQVVATVELGQLVGRPGAKAAELTWAGPITGEDARRIACDAGLTRIITEGASQPLDVGRTVRSFTPAIRRALLTQWKTCFWPGCTYPAEWAEGHHILPWFDGGETGVENGALACPHHHHVIHNQRWRLEKLPDGIIRVRLGAKEFVCKPNAP